MYTVAIVGRPNVGKSALFNRLVGKRIAIVDSTYGLTRDRVSASVSHGGARFTLVDTGGIDFNASDGIREMAKKQAELAISQAETVLLVTDVREGVVPLDIEIAALLRRAGKRVVRAANKADNEESAVGAAAFHSLGFPRVFAVSAAHGLGVSALADEIAAGAPSEEKGAAESRVRIAVVGKPNVGKSSCVNKMLREERMIVHEAPGTTRDAVDTEAVWRGHPVTLIDTAGLRREGRLKEAADFFSLTRTRTAIRRCDVVLLLFSAVEEVGAVEEKLARYVLDMGRGCVLGINKWDLTEGVNQSEYRQSMWRRMQFLNFAPLVFLSAKTGLGIDRALETVFYVHEQMRRKIATPLLNNVLHALWDRSEPPFRGGKRCKFYYGTQLGMTPPSFALFVNNRKLLDMRYESYLVNGLRRAFGFEGAPLRLSFRNRRP